MWQFSMVWPSREVEVSATTSDSLFEAIEAESVPSEEADFALLTLTGDCPVFSLNFDRFSPLRDGLSWLGLSIGWDCEGLTPSGLARKDDVSADKLFYLSSEWPIVSNQCCRGTTYVEAQEAIAEQAQNASEGASLYFFRWSASGQFNLELDRSTVCSLIDNAICFHGRV